MKLWPPIVICGICLILAWINIRLGFNWIGYLCVFGAGMWLEDLRRRLMWSADQVTGDSNA